ncbi:MAG: metal ABC transporter ATP-binding protein [Propionibacteriaceae bacterium]
MSLSTPGTPVASPAGSPTVAARRVQVVLGGQIVLHAVDLTVRAAETVALMGGNGSGKSTLVRAVLGLVPASQGEIELFGAPLPRFRDWRKIGYVPQRSVLGLANAKVREVVGSGRLAHRRPFLPARRQDRDAVTRALETVRLGHRADDEMMHLSGGQQQRVLIARALATDPELLVLDEPVAGVDLEHQQVLADVFGALVDHGTSVLVVLHEAGPIAGLVQRAVVLRDGHVVHDGPLPADLDHTRHTDHELGHGGGHEHHHPDVGADALSAWPSDPVDRARGGRGVRR